MTTRRELITLCSVSSLSLLLSSSAFADAGTEPLAVVAAKQGPIDDLELAVLKRLFLGESALGPSGLKLLALNRDTKSEQRVGFDRSVLGMSPEAAARYWIDRRIRGQSAAPKVVEPASVLQRVVSHLPGAVGYVRMSELAPDVKVVRIDGRKPGDAGYPIVASRGGSSA